MCSFFYVKLCCRTRPFFAQNLEAGREAVCLDWSFEEHGAGVRDRQHCAAVKLKPYYHDVGDIGDGSTVSRKHSSINIFMSSYICVICIGASHLNYSQIFSIQMYVASLRILSLSRRYTGTPQQGKKAALAEASKEALELLKLRHQAKALERLRRREQQQRNDE